MATQRPLHLVVPLERDWPVIGQEPDGTLILEEGFVSDVERLNGLRPGSLSGSRLINLLLAWYGERRRIGFAEDPAMEHAARKHSAA
ncbi:MAG: hypothetical protein ACHQZQ_03720 [SAR324 cluster bacterium]